MPKKKAKPDSSAAPSRGVKSRKVVFFRVPDALKSAIEQAAEYETTIRHHNVSLNEWLMRAAIDRIGEIYGTSVARQFYQQFFNGLGAVETEVPLPSAAEGTPILTFR